MLEITPSIQIDEAELQFTYIRAAGPGGQNVNKVATAVQLRFDIPASSLPADVKARLISQGGQRVTKEGVLIIEARRFRTQEQNRAAAIRRFVERVRKAAHPPKPRRETRPSRAARQRRMDAKKKQSEKKKLRNSPNIRD